MKEKEKFQLNVVVEIPSFTFFPNNNELAKRYDVSLHYTNQLFCRKYTRLVFRQQSTILAASSIAKKVFTRSSYLTWLYYSNVNNHLFMRLSLKTS